MPLAAMILTAGFMRWSTWIFAGRAGHDRHHHVRQHGGDLTAALAVDRNGFHPIGGDEGAVAHGFKRLLRDASHVVLIIHDQDQLPISMRQRCFRDGAQTIFSTWEATGRDTVKVVPSSGSW